ncbi:MAG: hypothetical protein JO308_10520 [Verrucomicrobia bacterium]|nr:hypothetical protein [Verrucomicrobiota bacterium]
MPGQLVLLDDAWPEDLDLTSETLDFRAWGPLLRYCAPERLIDRFYIENWQLFAPFKLYGSGDFHHLTALWLRAFEDPPILVSFDNHPDWDTRPPRWCCGTWVSRALEEDAFEHAAIWGCANFELNAPHRWFANHKGLRSGKLEIWPWIERFGPSARRKFTGITRADWQDQFTRFLQRLDGRSVYITIDLDCLARPEAITDWEQGLFTISDLEWALNALSSATKTVGGDICGAHSTARYSRWTQQRTAVIDHPKPESKHQVSPGATNLAAVKRLWPLLAGNS